MANFNLEDYEMVEVRIAKFYKTYQDGRIITELMSPVNDISTVIFKAFLYDGEKLLSTGHAFEIAGQGFVNKTSHLENSETSAIGRALANIGMHGNKRASREEMEKVQRSTPLPKKPLPEIQVNADIASNSWSDVGMIKTSSCSTSEAMEKPNAGQENVRIALSVLLPEIVTAYMEHKGYINHGEPYWMVNDKICEVVLENAKACIDKIKDWNLKSNIT